MILVDSGILLYAAGPEHPRKAPACRFLEHVAEERVQAAIDAAALEEILIHYRSIDRWRDGRRVYDLARVLFPEVLPINAEVLEHARALLDHVPALSARNAVKAAVVMIHRLEGICSFHGDFSRIRGCKRITPE